MVVAMLTGEVVADAAAVDAGGVRSEAAASTAATAGRGRSWPATRWRNWRPRFEAAAEVGALGVVAAGATAVAGGGGGGRGDPLVVLDEVVHVDDPSGRGRGGRSGGRSRGRGRSRCH
jgi:hypothetical protein